MFTGIIEALGKIVRVEPAGKGARIAIRCPFKSLALGESVAVDGVCLTVTARKAGKSGCEWSADAAEETLKKTTLGGLKPGAWVNLERSLKAGDHLGGHFVQGHVDGTGKILSVKAQGASKLYAFSFPPFLDPYLVPKGSIAVNGISLTLVDVGEKSFTVAIIPHTERNTSLRDRKAGDEVNLEADILAKVAAKQVRIFTQGRPPEGGLFQKKEITWEELMSHEEGAL